MPPVGFYHLQRSGIETALPGLLVKAHAQGLRALVRVASEDRAEHLSDVLWTFDPRSFLPHGTARDGHPADQPIYLTSGADCPNQAGLLILLDGTDQQDLSAFTRVCDMFDGRDPAAVEAARGRWRARKTQGAELTYWQQTESGGWARKA